MSCFIFVTGLDKYIHCTILSSNQHVRYIKTSKYIETNYDDCFQQEWKHRSSVQVILPV